MTDTIKAPIQIPEPQAFDSLLSLKGKTAIVTGGSKGLGKQVAKRFVEAGANVIITARGKDVLESAAAEIGAVAFQADSGKVEDSQKVIDFAVEKFEGLDIVVNNAAIFPASTALEMTEKIWDETFEIDTKGAFFMSQLAAKQFIKQGHGGRIIEFLSTAGIRPTSPLFAYGAAKSSLWYITQTLAQELAPHHITVNAVTPGATITPERIEAISHGMMGGSGVQDSSETFQKMQTEMAAKLPEMLKKMAPMGRPGWPDDLAKSVLFLASDMAEYVTGVNIVTDGAQSLQNPVAAQMPGGH